MSRGAWGAALLALTLAGPARAQPEAVEIAVLRPDPARPAFGLTVVEAEIYPAGAAVERVELFLDGLRRAQRQTPPWRFEVEAGDDNVEHLFELVAYPRDGAPATARVRTPRLESDLQVDAELRQLYVTVSRGDRRVLDLARGDFTVWDHGARQTLVTFERGDVPFSAALLLDTSGSMAGPKLATALAGVRRLLDALDALDEARLILFADRVLLESPSTNLASLVTVGMEAVPAAGGTALNDAVYLGLKRLEARQGRKVLILLSDGLDIDSASPMAGVRAVAQRGQAALYWIRLPRVGGAERGQKGTITAWRDAEQHRLELEALRRTVAESGGRTITITGVEQIDAAFAGLLAELRQQYVLGYYPSHTLGTGSWHPLRVEVAGDGLAVRTREGYLEP